MLQSDIFIFGQFTIPNVCQSALHDSVIIMLTPVMLHSASAFISRAGAGAVRPVFARLACSQPCRYQYRYLSQSPKDGKSRLPRRLNDEVLMPEAPPMSKEEIEYLKDFARNIDSKSGQIETVESESTDLPEAPSDAIEYDIDEEVEQDEEGEEIKAVPFSPFYMKSSMIPGEIMNLLNTIEVTNLHIPNNLFLTLFCKESTAVKEEN